MKKIESKQLWFDHSGRQAMVKQTMVADSGCDENSRKRKEISITTCINRKQKRRGGGKR